MRKSGVKNSTGNQPRINADKVGSVLRSRYAIVNPWFAEKVLASLLRDQPELFELVVRALDLAFIDGEFLAESCGRGELFARRQSLVLDLGFDLLANLSVDRIVRKIFQFDVHNISQRVRVTLDNERGASGLSPFASANNAANS